MSTSVFNIRLTCSFQNFVFSSGVIFCQSGEITSVYFNICAIIMNSLFLSKDKFIVLSVYWSLFWLSLVFSSQILKDLIVLGIHSFSRKGICYFNCSFFFFFLSLTDVFQQVCLDFEKLSGNLSDSGFLYSVCHGNAKLPEIVHLYHLSSLEHI